MTKELGKIRNIILGFGGYQDSMFGLTINFDMRSGSISTFISGGWYDNNLAVNNSYESLCKEIINFLKQAKVSSIDQLKNKPVEISLDRNTFVSFRILTEVL